MQQDSLLGRLRAIRSARRLTIREVAAGSGLAISHVSRLERGLAGVSLEMLEKYLAVCRYHLEIVPDDGSDPTVVHVGDLEGDRLKVVRELAYVVPDLPDALVENLRDQINLWNRRYGGEKS